MSQLFAIMLIGRQAFLILMATETRRLQSVSHDIHWLADPPCWRSQRFWENHVPWVLFGRAPRPKVCGKFGEDREDEAAIKNFSWRGKVGFLSSRQQVLVDHLQARPGMGMAGRCKRLHHPCLTECSTSLWSPGLRMWSNSILMQREEACHQWPSPASWF